MSTTARPSSPRAFSVSNVERLAGMLLVIYWLVIMVGMAAAVAILGYLFLLGLGALAGV
jgi:hypothetical protein